MDSQTPSIEKLQKQLRVLKRKLERSDQHRVDLENQHDRDQHLYRRLHAELDAARRTAEVEAALQRVRTQAMAMRTPDDLAGISEAVFTELKGLGFEALRNTEIVINHETETCITSYYYSDYGVTGLIDVDYRSNPTVEAWARDMQQADDAFAEVVISEEEVADWRAYRLSLGYVPDPKLDDATAVYYYSYAIGLGALSISSFEPVSAEYLSVLEQFRNAFNLAYQRYVDIARAEAQAYDAQIQLALERARAQSMRMQHSSELVATSAVFHEQLLALGVATELSYVWLPDEAAGQHQFWATWTEVKDGVPVHRSKAITYDLDKEEPYTAACFAAWASDDPIHIGFIPPAEVDPFFSSWPELIGDAQHMRPEHFPDGLYYAEAYMQYGCFGIDIRRELTKGERDILGRFAIEFERAYIRFLDLQKAEAQAREAQIEASLERVRARAMAMHSSDDISDATAIVFSELERLGISTLRCGIIIIHESMHMDTWTASATQDGDDLRVLGRIDMKIHPMLEGLFEAWKTGESTYVYEMVGEDMHRYYEAIWNSPDYHLPRQRITSERQTVYAFIFSEGALFAFAEDPLETAWMQIFQRFAAVFALTYRRYLDLKQAEEQAREAQIETALERVRSRTMAMRRSDELAEVAALLVEQVTQLGIETWTCGFNILTSASTVGTSWMASPKGGMQAPFAMPHDEDPTFQQIYAAWQQGEDSFTEALGGDELAAHYAYMMTVPGVQALADDVVDAGLELPTYQVFYAAFFTHGYLMFITRAPHPEAEPIFVRFARVFDQTYTRFQDLKQAEEQARQAQRRAAIDRVRAEIASMRTAEDLQRITPLIWRELTTLKVPFFRCGVFIIDEATETVQVFLTTPKGKALAALTLGFDDATVVSATVAHWQTASVYTEEWDAAQMRTWTQFLQERGLIETPTRYLNEEAPPEHLSLHFVPFGQGMLYVGSRASLQAADLDAVQALADAFSVAYARYEDFQRLEAKKQEVEAALEELHRTQHQLVQQEKMASLGALTAGIAHEIKNPLNFINNFAAINEELVGEIEEAWREEEHEEAAELLAMVLQNSSVIAHHGKRADSIVRNMMAHARTGNHEHKPTDLNTLVSEHLDLAYHGKRATSPGYTVTVERDLDETVGEVTLVPQDIGRVVLNLLSNAFDAVDGVAAPRVTVSTHRQNGQVTIRVDDNGPGIPDEVKAKVFEPFFTTKPTGQGTGLGLSLSYDIVTQGHGGMMTVESEEGAGASFVVTLPTVPVVQPPQHLA